MLQADSKSYIDTHVVLIVESDNNDSKYTFLQRKCFYLHGVCAYEKFWLFMATKNAGRV